MIYLHIGTEKTGSTSIQNFLWKNRQIKNCQTRVLFLNTAGSNDRVIEIRRV